MMRPSERCSSPAKPPPTGAVACPAELPEATWDIPRSCCSMPSMEEIVVMGRDRPEVRPGWSWGAPLAPVGRFPALPQVRAGRIRSQFQPSQGTRRHPRPMDRNRPENPVYSPDCLAQVWPIIATVPEERGPWCRAGAGHHQTTIHSGVRVFSLQRNVSNAVSRAVSRADDQGGQHRPCRRERRGAGSGARA
ncbi:hypothetical protein CBM2586_B10391 [Cupriavidus phytorum]|uniref:Uncharacterized protein n=1 Tax=Cupriavidus taiwanensis TaxID=164546 RepID=A0A375C9P4_9BURK|nr:hypothetical protein CBM2586_B10391 [Cupriavidus taiwanensis]